MKSHFGDKHYRAFNPASLFHAALGDEDWNDVLKAYSEELDCSVYLTHGDPSLCNGFFTRTFRYDFSVFDGGPIDCEDEYNPEVNPFIVPIAAARTGIGIDRREILSDQASERHPFMRQVVFSQGIRHSRLANISTAESGLACIWIGQSKAKGPIESDQSEAFDRSLGHFSAALRTRGMIARDDDVLRNLQYSIDRLHYGVVAVDANLKVTIRNTAAAAMLSAVDGISERQNKLTLHFHKDQATLEVCIRRLASGDLYTNLGGLTVQRPSRLPPYRLTVAPSEGLHVGLGAPRSVALITLHDPMVPKTPLGPDHLAMLHGVSVAEARVVRLVALGLTKRQIGEELGVTENTVRTQLASAREKVGARNLTELAFLIG